MKDIKIKQNKESLIPLKRAEGEINDSLSPSLLAKQVLIKGENRKEFLDLVAKIRAEIHISTQTEEEFLKKYIFSLWKLKRARVMEKNLLNSQQEFTEEEVLSSGAKRRIRNLKRIRLSEEIQKIISYQDRLEKQTIKALRHLKGFAKLL